jgi:hypothetical protein
VSFIALWDKALALYGTDEWLLIDSDVAPLGHDAVVVMLNPHLHILSEGFAMPRPAERARQLELFRATALREPACPPVAHPPRDDVERRGRSA